MNKNSWDLNLTSNQIFFLSEYPIQGKDGVAFCELHGGGFEMKEVVVYDRGATEFDQPDHCRVCVR